MVLADGPSSDVINSAALRGRRGGGATLCRPRARVRRGGVRGRLEGPEDVAGALRRAGGLRRGQRRHAERLRT